MLKHILFEDAELGLLEESDADELYALLDANRSPSERMALRPLR